MEVWIYRFTAKQLRSIHSDHLGFILASSHCCNELASVSPYIIFEHEIDEANEVENAFIQTRFFTLVRHQIGKIFEYRDLCNSYVGKLRKTYPASAEKLGKRIGEISRRIDRAEWARTVRNKVAFHFDPSYVEESLAHLPNDQPLNFVVGRIHGVTNFTFVDRILVESMFRDAGDGDKAAGRTIVQRWTIDLQKLITHLHAEIMESIFARHGLIRRAEESEIRDKYCAERGNVCIPLSTPERDEPLRQSND